MLDIDDGEPAAAPAVAPTQLPSEGPWRICMLVGQEGGRGAGVVAGSDLPQGLEGPGLRAFGVALIRWRMVLAHSAQLGEDPLPLLTAHAKSKTKKLVTSYLAYELGDVARPLHGGALDICRADLSSPSALLRRLEGETLCRRGGDGPLQPRLGRDIVQAWVMDHGLQARKGCFVAVFDTAFLAAMCNGRWIWATALGRGRLPRREFFLAARPPAAKMRARASAVVRAEAAVAAAPVGAQPFDGNLGTALPVEGMVEWIDATMDLKGLRRSDAAKKKWARIFGRVLALPAEEIAARAGTVSYAVLQRARSQLDATAMLLFRYWWDAQVQANVDVYIFTDGSPQWRGAELFATTMDIVIRQRGQEPVVLRRLLPVVQLGLNVRTAVGKAMGLLWQLFLLLGPDEVRFRSFLRRVRSLTTDFGVEHYIPAMRDILPEFWRWAAGRELALPMWEKLFPFALLAPGWAHICDGLLQRCLFALDWFPAWVDILKAVLKFLRHHKQDIADDLGARDLPAVAEMVLVCSFQHFAVWRWGTIAKGCEDVARVHSTITQHYDRLTFVKKMKDQKLLKKVDVAMRGVLWRKRLRFVLWVSVEVTRLQIFARACPVHQGGCPEGCKNRGRQLPFADARVERALAHWQEQSDGWTSASFEGMPFEELNKLRAAVRVLIAFAKDKFGFLKVVPYLLARADDLEVLRECRDQWRSAPPEHHHPVTRAFFEEGSPIAGTIDACLTYGVHDYGVLDMVDGYAGVMFDDSLCESPHARANRAWANTRATRFPWLAATVRVEQNIEDVQQHLASPLVSVQECWNKWSAVLQKRPNTLRGVKLRRGEALKRIYYVRSAPEVEGEAYRECGSADVAPAPLVDAVEGAEGAPAAAAGPDQPTPATNDQKLMLEWLSHTIDEFDYVGFPREGPGESGYVIYQLLAKRTHIMRVVTFRAGVRTEKDAWLWQPVEALEDLAVADLEDTHRLQVFCIDEAKRMHPCLVFGNDPKRRATFRRWTAAPGRRENCVSLIDAQPLRAKGSLFDADAPVLSLLDQLAAEAFRPVRALVNHAPAMDLTFDAREISSKRNYLQAVLRREAIFAKGQGMFPSTRSQAWYRLLLKSRGPVPTTMLAKEAERLLDSLEAGEELGPAQPLPEPPAPAAIVGPLAGPRLLDIDEGEPAPAPPPVLDIDADVGEGASGSGGPSLEIDALFPVPPVVAADALVDDSIPTHILGRRVTVERKGHNVTLRVTCVRHAKCKIGRSVNVWRDDLGPRAAAFFIGCWLSAAADHDGDHSQWKPNLAEVRAYRDSLPAP